MPDHQTSGIRVEENASAEHVIAGAATAVTAFVGRTLRGPVNRPVRVHNFKEFQHAFGGLWSASTLSYAVDQFFENGGAEAVIVRVINGGRCATISLPSGEQTLTLEAFCPGTREALRASVDYDNISEADPDSFNLVIQRMRNTRSRHVQDQEIYARASIREDSRRYIGRLLVDSHLAKLSGPVPTTRPDRTVSTRPGYPVSYIYTNPDGDDGRPLTDYDIIGSAVEVTGIFALKLGGPFNLLCIPPLSRERDIGPTILLVATRFCKQQRAILLIDCPREWRSSEAAANGARDLNLSSENALLLFPRIVGRDRLHEVSAEFPPSGAVAGMLCRLDERGEVWQEPGQVGVRLRATRFACTPSPKQSARLAMLGVNALPALSIGFPAYRLRTLAGAGTASSDWRLLSARRLTHYVIDSIEFGTRWVVFERSDETLWQSVRLQVEEFLGKLFARGAFAGSRTQDAYFLVCDSTVNSDTDMSTGTVNLVVGFAIAQPRQFHVYQITQSIGGTRVREMRREEYVRFLRTEPLPRHATETLRRLSERLIARRR